MEYRNMRRKERQTSDSEALEILNNASHGVLSLSGKDAQPYGVAISHVNSYNKIYFHCAHDGFKVDLIKENNKVHFFAISQEKVNGKGATVDYKSVSVFGRAYIVQDPQEKAEAFRLIIDKFMQGFIDEGKKTVQRSGNKTTIVAIEIKHITGKYNN